jgi:hypothetical protein
MRKAQGGRLVSWGWAECMEAVECEVAALLGISSGVVCGRGGDDLVRRRQGGDDLVRRR